MPHSTCSVLDCHKPKMGAGLCSMHYSRQRRTGTLEGVATGRCKRCEREFTHPRKSGQRPLFCSEECRATPERVFPDCCVVCGGATGDFKPYRRYCSAKCQTEYTRHPGGRKIERNCIECGCALDFTQVRPGGSRLRANTRKCFTCRRNQVPELSAKQLAERDGLDCSICGGVVDFDLKWPHRFSPSIDHVFPYSRGGGNEPENLALAHLTCNISKKDKVSA